MSGEHPKPRPHLFVCVSFIRSMVRKLRALYVYWQTGGLRSIWYRTTAMLPRDRERHCHELTNFHTRNHALPSAGAKLISPGRTVVYTAVVADYDDLMPFEFDDVEAVCFTDRTDAVPAGWSAVRVNAPCGVRLARQIKVLSHKYAGDAEWSIWIDGNLQLRVHPHEIVRCVIGGGADLASFRHPERECTYNEAQIVQFLELDDSELVDRQMERYRVERLPRRFGLLETAIVVRRNTARVRQLNQLWWQEISHGSHRDQLSAMYAL